MELTKEMRKVASKAKSVEDLFEMAKEHGLPITEEEAKEIYKSLNAEGELSDDELENVAGGSFCIDGRSYSDDPPHYLIVTAINSCPFFLAYHTGDTSICANCTYENLDGGILYCWARTADNDPYR